MVPQKRFFLLLIVFHFITLNEVSTQEIFTRFRSVIHSIDTNTCKTAEKFSIDEEDGTYIMRDFKFHPNGRLYAITRAGILEIDAITWTLRDIIPWTQFTAPPQFNVPHLAHKIIFDEEGIGMISGGSIEGNLFFYYDMQDRKLIKERIIYREEYSPALAPFSNKVGKYFFVGIQKQDSLLFDFETLRYVYIPTWPLFADHFGIFYNSGVENNPCTKNPVLVGFGEYEKKWSIIKADIFEGKLSALCAEEIDIRSSQVTTPTDFRDSPLRIDLDSDNSSGHITAGYYDTLTTCRKEVPVMDADMELYTCGAEVDYISFRLRNYDNPRLAEERIYSEGFADPVQTSPGRYEWENTFGPDQDKIKEYLSSLRYFSDWSDPDERERVVMTTMHVGEDSTTSWSVYQLERDEVYAGRDTTITFCPDDSSLELTDYLSAGVSKDGRIDPELVSGTTVFTPGQDADGDYLYILEKMDCADTAVLTVKSLETGLEDIELDTVSVCKGQQARIGFPSGRYDSIEWWDGSTGDSVWISADGADHFVLVGQGGCGITIPITVLEQDVEGIAGRDTTIRYCMGGAVIDLTKILGLPDEYSYEITPVLNGGSLVFDPLVDTAGAYQLVASVRGCTDTATIEMEETTTQELVLDPVRLCAGTTQRIGLEPGKYDQVMWWNDDSGDSTTVSDEDSGPFTVEARLDGCVYQGEVDVTIVPEVVLPDGYPDHLTICEGDPPGAEKITVTGLDSVLWENSIYYPGEDILIMEEGEYTIRGYQGGCFTEKTITVDVMKDPSANYSYIAEWCGLQPLTLKLPDDNATWRFRWEDGTDSISRIINSIGRYPFLIHSDSCEYTGFFDVIEGTDCDKDCTVSIPNAISPNGDGVNDNLEVFSSCDIRVIEIRIFDKWGGELYRVQSGEVEASIWSDLPPGVVMVQVRYQTNPPEAGKVGVVKTVAQGVLVLK